MPQARSLSEELLVERTLPNRYRVTGLMGRDRPKIWQRSTKRVTREYVSSLVEGNESGEMAPSGFNALQLAREDGIYPTMCVDLGETTDNEDRRLRNYDPDKMYEPRAR